MGRIIPDKNDVLTKGTIYPIVKKTAQAVEIRNCRIGVVDTLISTTFLLRMTTVFCHNLQ